MVCKLKLLFLMLMLGCVDAMAHTWDEPWHKEVVSQANSFGLYEVKKVSGQTLKLKLVKHLAGEKTKKKIKVSDFYLYEKMSSSAADEHGFWLGKGQRVYLYLHKDGRKYTLATPTAGSDKILDDESVGATFRHSLHKTQIDIVAYEALQTCIFISLHNGACASETVDFHILVPLKERVSVLSAEALAEDFELFFKQHAALESAYLAGYALPNDLLAPFLESEFFHVQISAVRALSVSHDAAKVKKLVDFVLSKHGTGIAKVMAVIMLNELKASDVNERLQAYLPISSSEEVYLGGDIMDPRIGTWYPPSVKAAIEWFLSE